MADEPAAGRSTVLKSLSRANSEPGRGTIFVVVSMTVDILYAVLDPRLRAR